MTVQRVSFIRPGETDWNANNRWQGWLDVPLNLHGKRQAERLANFMRNIGLRAVYTSDLRRAAQTADIIAEACGVQAKRDERLRERAIGRWQGLSREEVAKWFPDQHQAYETDKMHYRIPDGESLADVQERVVAAFHAIVAEGAAETIAIVSHTVTIRVLLEALIGGYDALTNHPRNSSVTTIHRTAAGGWEMVVSDDVQHLEGMPSLSSLE
jgi:broad specificity phosphatase PhoE